MALKNTIKKLIGVKNQQRIKAVKAQMKYRKTRQNAGKYLYGGNHIIFICRIKAHSQKYRYRNRICKVAKNAKQHIAGHIAKCTSDAKTAQEH